MSFAAGAGLSNIKQREDAVSEPEVLMEGIVFGESPRWHDGRLWFSDWGAHQVIAVDPGGSHQVVVTVASFPMCIDFLPDGRLLVVDSAQRRLLRLEPGGSLVQHAGFPRSRTSPGTISWPMTGGTPTSIPSVSTSRRTVRAGPGGARHPGRHCSPGGR
jgi:sugar lactone lactonase YvrE